MTYRMVLVGSKEVAKLVSDLDATHVRKLLENVSLTYSPIAKVALIVGQDIHWEATDFLLEVALQGESVTGDTVRSYGEALVQYLNYQNEHGQLLEGATEKSLQIFRNSLLSSNCPQGRATSPRTINLRITAVCRFHLWGQRTSRMGSPLGKLLIEQRGQVAGHRQSAAWNRGMNIGQPRFLVSAEKKLPKILVKEELWELFAVAPQPFSLMFKWAAVTGLRRMELSALQIDNLPSRLECAPRRLREMTLIRKGGKHATVYLPSALLDETWWYVLTERPKPKSSEIRNVFLVRTGLPVSRQYLSTVFRNCCASIKPDATLHHLRHTFAVITLDFLQRRAEKGDSINPLKTLQVLMGHSSIESTEVYLRALDLYSEAVEEALHYLYGDEI